MRITGGSARGRLLSGPGVSKRTIRPTSDRVREALFNILGERVIGCRFLDCFAGTGAVGLEAMSRGAQACVLVDQSNEALKIIQENQENCFPEVTSIGIFHANLTKQSAFVRLRAKLPSDFFFDIVFIDPPYEKNLAETTLSMVEKSKLLAPKALIVLEERKNSILPERGEHVILLDQRQYGETGLWIYATQTDKKTRP